MYAGVCSHAAWPASVLGGVSAKFGLELHAGLSLRVFSLISDVSTYHGPALRQSSLQSLCNLENCLEFWRLRDA